MDKRAQNIPARPELARELGLSHAGAVVVGTIIGSGIFLVPTEMMQAVGSARLVYLAWLVGGLLSFFGALTYAELGAMKPQVGGEYVYVRDAYGPLAGFLYSWTWFLIAKPASIATVTTFAVMILSSVIVAPGSEPAHTMRDLSIGDQMWVFELLAARRRPGTQLA